MALSKTTFLQDILIVSYVILISLQIVCAVIKFPKIKQDKILLIFENLRCQNSVNLKSGRFSAKIEKGGPYHVIQTGY